MFMLAGSPISWTTRKQQTVANSSTEAEYMALEDDAKEAMYFQNILRELSIDVLPLKIYNDNRGAEFMAKILRKSHSQTEL